MKIVPITWKFYLMKSNMSKIILQTKYTNGLDLEIEAPSYAQRSVHLH